MLSHLLEFDQVFLNLKIWHLHVSLLSFGVVLGRCWQLLVRLIIFIVRTINYVKLQPSSSNYNSVLTLVVDFLCLLLLFCHHTCQFSMTITQMRRILNRCSDWILIIKFGRVLICNWLRCVSAHNCAAGFFILFCLIDACSNIDILIRSLLVKLVFSARFWNRNSSLLFAWRRQPKMFMVVTNRWSDNALIIASYSTICNGSINVGSNETLIYHRDMAVIEVICRALLSIVILKNDYPMLLILYTLRLFLRTQEGSSAITYVVYILHTLANCLMNNFIISRALVGRSGSYCVLWSHIVVAAEFLINLRRSCDVVIVIHRLRAASSIERNSHLLIWSSYIQIWRRVITNKTLMTLACGCLKIVSASQDPVWMNVNKLTSSVSINRSLGVLSNRWHLLLTWQSIMTLEHTSNSVRERSSSSILKCSFICQEISYETLFIEMHHRHILWRVWMVWSCGASICILRWFCNDMMLLLIEIEGCIIPCRGLF